MRVFATERTLVVAALFTVVLLIAGAAEPVLAKQRPPFLVLNEEYYCDKCEFDTKVRVPKKLTRRAIALVVRDFIDSDQPLCGEELKGQARVSLALPRGVRFKPRKLVVRDKSNEFNGKEGQLGLSAAGLLEPNMNLPTTIGVLVSCSWAQNGATWHSSVALFRMPWGQFVAFPQLTGSVMH